MKPNLLRYAGGLGVVAAALLGVSPAQAQGFCYMVGPEGEVVNLDALCAESNSPAPAAPQAAPPTPEDSAVGEAAAESQGEPSEVTRVRIVGPAVTPDSSPDSGAATSTTPSAVESIPEGLNPVVAPGSTPAEAGSPGSAPATEPASGAETPETPGRSPQSQGPTFNQVETPSRVVNGIVIEGVDEVIVTPSGSDAGA
ncbi:MAG TPA: hypothetical protein VLS96_14405, partial [Nodosilinea sp.]|nr:hypothetical protein [Nodosilinea sp.]